jgi:signal transduction histidine kinase
LGLADFIRTKRDVIVSEWEAFARSLVPVRPKLSTLVLRDHVTAILDAIVVDMESHQSAEEQAAKSKGRGESQRLEGAGTAHATLRIETGFRLDQLVGEYRALRASILRLWTEAAPPDPDLYGITRFNEAIDEALTESTNRYMHTLERHRDQFLGILGHDLRIPLGAIVTGAGALTASTGLDDESVRTASRIKDCALRMERMVGDLLDLTRTRLGEGLPIVRAQVDLGHVCQQVVAEIHEAYPGALLRFEPNGDLHGEWDRDRLAQAISNLVGNALQHVGKMRPVMVVARGERDEVLLEVHNEGPPIPQSEISGLFEPMARRRGAANEKSTHLGLGLYIVKQVVAAHGGQVGVTSTDSGTTFVLHLPRSAPAERSPAT